MITEKRQEYKVQSLSFCAERVPKMDDLNENGDLSRRKAGKVASKRLITHSDEKTLSLE